MAKIGGRNVSVERALRWLQGFAQAEWSLILPVGLMFFGLPRLIVTMLLDRQLANVPPTIAGWQAFGVNLPGWWKLMLAGVLLLALAGAMTLMAMALRPRISVGEAIAEAMKRLPVALGAGAIISASLFLLVLVVMTVVALIGGGEIFAVALVFLGMLATMLATLMLLPVAMLRPVGPIAVIIDGWGIYSGSILRIVGGLVLFAVGAWIVALAVQVSIGSLLMIAAQALGQKQAGDDLAALLISFVATISWSGFYLLIAGFYRQRIGTD